MKKLTIYCFIGILILSCADFIEYPLEGESVELLAPITDFNSEEPILTFWWDTHQDARYYRLQLVQPDFQNTQKLIADSIVTGNKLTLELDKGIYSWRVRPENEGSHGDYTEERTLVITKNEEQ